MAREKKKVRTDGVDDRTRESLTRRIKGSGYVPGFGIERQRRTYFRGEYSGEFYEWKWKLEYRLGKIHWTVWQEGGSPKEGKALRICDALAWVKEIIATEVNLDEVVAAERRAARQKKRREKYQKDPEYRARRLEENRRAREKKKRETEN